MDYFVKYLLLTLLYNVGLGRSRDIREELDNYEFVDVYHTNERVRNSRDLSTLVEGMRHLQKTSFHVFAFGKNWTLHVTQNDLLIPKTLKMVYQNEDGTRNIVKGEKHLASLKKVCKTVEKCHYHGKIENQQNSKVTLSTCDGIRGSVADANGEQFFIDHISVTGKTQRNYIVYKMKDMKPKENQCGGHHFANEMPIQDFTNLKKVSNKKHNGLLRTRRNAITWNYIEVAVVVDYRKHKQWGNNSDTSRSKALEIMNHVDSVYKTLQTRVTVVSIIVWNATDEITVETSPTNTLSAFSTYTANTIHGLLKIYNDNAQLITGIDFDGSVVGYGGIGVICSLSSSAVSMDHNPNPAVTANTVAHEMGHNLGFFHNGGQCTCSNPPCTMQAVGTVSPVKGFSSCAEEKFKQSKASGHYPCLSDYPEIIYGPAVCGDGYKEEGEECDCGTEQDCKLIGADACCNFTTCKLNSDAECADGACCENCKFKERGILCRNKTHSECDLEEYCSGNSNHCQRNFFVENGKNCSNSSGYCYQGQCRVHTTQCEKLWGKNGDKANDFCFNLNTRADGYGNCGVRQDGSFIKCHNGDLRCGKIQCQAKPGTSLPTWPLLGSNRAKIIVTISTGSDSFRCIALKMTISQEQEDPTMTYDGTKCAENSVCISHKCTNLSTIQNVKKCDKECMNGGVCNSNGNCHCPYGFACPYCKEEGKGGSIDSGQGCYERKDVNDCHENTNICHKNATCHNTNGTYICSCNEGFSGNGTFCYDVNDCHENTNICHKNATCHNTNGTYICSCNEGFSGNGTFCYDVNDCHENTNICHKKATCHNTNGTYICSCNEGFSGNGTFCYDACNITSTCPSNSDCFNFDFGPVCVCHSSHQLYVKNQNRCVSGKAALKVIGLKFNLTYQTEYRNKKSNQFAYISRRISQTILKFLQVNVSNIIGIRVIDIRPGSIVVDLEIIFNQTVRKETKDKLKDYIKNGARTPELNAMLPSADFSADIKGNVHVPDTFVVFANHNSTRYVLDVNDCHEGNNPCKDAKKVCKVIEITSYQCFCIDGYKMTTGGDCIEKGKNLVIKVAVPIIVFILLVIFFIVIFKSCKRANGKNKCSVVNDNGIQNPKFEG